MLRIISVLCLACSLQLVAAPKSFSEYCLTPANEAQINLVKRILRAMDLPDERSPIICDAAQKLSWQIEELNVRHIELRIPFTFESKVYEPITDLQPLESLTRLKKLTLEGNELQLSEFHPNPLKNLSYLSELRIRSAGIHDIKFVQDLPNLESLILGVNHVSDLSPLKGLKFLKSLEFGGQARIEDLSVLASLPRLERLLLNSVLTSTKIDDLEFVRPLVGLKELSLNGHNIKYLFPLQELKQLEVLSLGSNRIMDVEPLVPLKNLRKLNLRSNNIHDVGMLRHLTSLEELDLSVNQISEVRQLEGLVNMVKLNFAGNTIEHMWFKKMVKLEELNMRSNKVHGLWGLPEQAALRKIDLSHNQVKSVDRVNFIPELETLNLYENQISDIWQFRAHKTKRLQWLVLDRNQVEDVTPLKDYRDLIQLNIRENPVKDFSPLAPLEELHENSAGKLVRLQIYK